MLTTRLRPLLHVFVDAGCQLRSEPALRDLSVVPVDVLNDDRKFAEGGVLLLGARTTDGVASLNALKELRGRNPDLIVCLCTRWEPVVLKSLARYTRAGVDRFFSIDSPMDVLDLHQFLKTRILAAPPQVELRLISSLTLARQPLAITQHAFRNSQLGESMEAVAKRFGRALRTIEYWLQASFLPRASVLFRCGRFLHVVELDRRGVRDVSEHAARLGFATATDLRQWRWRLRRTARDDSRLDALAQAVPSLQQLLQLDDDL